MASLISQLIDKRMIQSAKKKKRKIGVFQIDLSFKPEMLLNFACVFWLSNNALRMFIAKILSVAGMQKYAGYILAPLIFIPLIVYFLMKGKFVGKYFWLFLAGVAAFFGITYAMHPEYRHWYTRDAFGIWDTVFRPDRGAIWAFLFIEIARNEDDLWKIFKASAFINFFYNFYFWFKAKRIGYWTYINASGMEEKRSYSLDFGYNMVFVFLILIFSYSFERKRWQLLAAALVLILTLDSGSRGSMAGILIAAGFSLIDSRWRTKERVRNLAVFGSVGLLIYVLWERMLLLLILVMKKYSIESRTLTMLASGDVTSDNGRDLIHKIILKRIEEHPFRGYGAFGDRQCLGPRFNWGYSHSILYEMWADFGVIFGTLILGGILFFAVRAIIKEKNPKKKTAFVVVLSLASRLAFSNTSWGDPYFWMLIALNVKWPVKGKSFFRVTA